LLATFPASHRHRALLPRISADENQTADLFMPKESEFFHGLLDLPARRSSHSTIDHAKREAPMNIYNLRCRNPSLFADPLLLATLPLSAQPGGILLRHQTPLLPGTSAFP
jgi:hypothetical protein